MKGISGMKEKTKLRVIQILVVVSLLITVFSIQRTYARYFEKIDTNYQTDAKKWVIKVDGTKIHELGKDELSEVMQPVLRENEHMNNNQTLVPGREGYFEFAIDYSEVDVAFRFQFNIKQLNTVASVEGEGDNAVETVEDNHLEDFEIYGYSIVESSTDGDVETITEITPVNDMSKLTQVIDPRDNSNENKTINIRVLFRWNDDNKDTTDDEIEDGMNNFEDTTYRGETNEADALHSLFKYNVKVTFTQVI